MFSLFLLYTIAAQPVIKKYSDFYVNMTFGSSYLLTFPGIQAVYEMRVFHDSVEIEKAKQRRDIQFSLPSYDISLSFSTKLNFTISQTLWISDLIVYLLSTDGQLYEFLLPNQTYSFIYQFNSIPQQLSYFNELLYVLERSELYLLVIQSKQKYLINIPNHKLIAGFAIDTKETLLIWYQSQGLDLFTTGGSLIKALSQDQRVVQATLENYQLVVLTHTHLEVYKVNGQYEMSHFGVAVVDDPKSFKLDLKHIIVLQKDSLLEFAITNEGLIQLHRRPLSGITDFGLTDLSFVLQRDNQLEHFLAGIPDYECETFTLEQARLGYNLIGIIRHLNISHVLLHSGDAVAYLKIVQNRPVLKMAPIHAGVSTYKVIFSSRLSFENELAENLLDHYQTSSLIIATVLKDWKTFNVQLGIIIAFSLTLLLLKRFSKIKYAKINKMISEEEKT